MCLRGWAQYPPISGCCFLGVTKLSWQLYNSKQVASKDKQQLQTSKPCSSNQLLLIGVNYFTPKELIWRLHDGETPWDCSPDYWHAVQGTGPINVSEFNPLWPHHFIKTEWMCNDIPISTMQIPTLATNLCNLFLPCDAKWPCKSWSTLSQVMACLLPDGTMP